jgi:hypothetical protein
MSAAATSRYPSAAGLSLEGASLDGVNVPRSSDFGFAARGIFRFRSSFGVHESELSA